ncbi:MAG: outer membrane protein assembly factor BamE [Proteobacteria bacterium]|nr:outer membrane protein assembly factor BamE [Pseudomonadota bacterium]
MRTLLALLGAAAALVGCDPARVAKLEEGVSTEAQVRQEFGEPVTVTVLPDGQRVLDYPRQPEGWTNYRITIGTDGKMSSLRQLLNADNFARVQPGLTEMQVRELLGRPAKSQPWPLKSETELLWRFRPDANASKIFSVYFDTQGRALRTTITDDPRTQAQMGN